MAACAGDNANILITASGKLLGCGANRNGELGVGDEEERDEFVQLGGDKLRSECIVKASTSTAEHTLVLTANGKLYGFGSNESGQLGGNTWADIYVSPKLIKLSNVTDIYAGDYVSYVVTNGNELHCISSGARDGDFDPFHRCPSLAEGLLRGICGGPSRDMGSQPVQGLFYLTSPKHQSELLYEWVWDASSELPRPPMGGLLLVPPQPPPPPGTLSAGPLARRPRNLPRGTSGWTSCLARG